jgi:hypothetical protein
MSLDAFEKAQLHEFIKYTTASLPKRTWQTPDRQWWTPQSTVIGYRERVSDHWAWAILHRWIATQNVRVTHVALPQPLCSHQPTDNAWAYINHEFGPGELGPEAHPIGQADLFCPGDANRRGLMVEFGTCAPAKFVLNLAVGGTDAMIVPYGCPYAFVFLAPKRELLVHVPGPRAGVTDQNLTNGG